MSRSIPDGLRRHQAARRQQSREALLDAAADLFLEQGYARTTMANLAAAAGVSPATLYKAFASKEELFRAMVVRELEEARKPFLDGIPTFSNAREACEFVVARLKFVFTETRITGLTRLAFAEGAAHPELHDLFRGPDGGDQTQALAELILTAFIAQGLFRPCNVSTASRQFLGMISQGLIHEPHVRGEPIPNLDVYLSDCIDLFCSHYAIGD